MMVFVWVIPVNFGMEKLLLSVEALTRVVKSNQGKY